MKTRIVVLIILTLFLLGGILDIGLAKERKQVVRYGHTWGEEKPGGTIMAIKDRVGSQNLGVRVNLIGVPVFVWTKLPQVQVTPDKLVNQKNHSSAGGNSITISK